MSCIGKLPEVNIDPIVRSRWAMTCKSSFARRSVSVAPPVPFESTKQRAPSGSFVSMSALIFRAYKRNMDRQQQYL